MATLITGNAAVFGTAAARANKAGAGTALDLPNLALGRAAVMRQKTLDGLPIAVGAQMRLLVGPNRELAARQPRSPSSDADQQRQRLRRLRAAAGRAADPGEPLVPVLGSTGGAGLRLRLPQWGGGAAGHHRQCPGVDGVEVSVIFDFGVGAIDWRGAWFNPGT